MSASSRRFDRRFHNSARVALAVATAAGSAAWSLIGRGGVPPTGLVPAWPGRIEPVDVTIPSLYRN